MIDREPASFRLIDHRSRQVSERDFRGKPLMIFFGFTACPDVCPTALGTTGAILDALGSQADEIVPIFISVDPERDSPELLGEYVAAFHPRIVGLTGTTEQVEATARTFGIHYRKVSTADGYTMDHTAVTRLIDRNGLLVATLDPHESLEVMIGKTRRLLTAPPSKP